jgi:hypothetical protein
LDESLDFFILRNFAVDGRSFQPLVRHLWLSSCIGINPGHAVIAYDEGFHECGIRVMVHFEICPGIFCITQVLTEIVCQDTRLALQTTRLRGRLVTGDVQ